MSKVYSNTGLPQEIRKISNYLNQHLKESEKEEEIKSEVCRTKEISMIREEMNRIEILKIEKDQ